MSGADGDQSYKGVGMMMLIPNKCLDCEHTIVQLEDVHKGWCKYEMEPVVRCDCFPVHYKVGCASAEMYCEKEINQEGD